MESIDVIKNKYIRHVPKGYKPKIILFSGKAESGKSTSSKMLVKLLEENNERVVIIPYGDYVKNTARLIFGWDGSKDENGRALLQWWGTDVVRKKDPNFWIETVYRLINVAGDLFDYVIIDDARFENEIAFWKETTQFKSEYKTFTVNVLRLDHENILTEEQRNHPSECSLDGYIFDSNIVASNIEELEIGVRKIYNDIKEYFDS